MLRSVHEFSKTVNGRSWQVSVWEVRRAGHRREDLCSFLRMRSAEAHLYSHCHHRVHVLYYLWSHTGTAHCSSPTSYREFAPGKLIHGGEKNTVMAAKAKSCEWRRLLERKIRCWRDEFEARGSESWPKPSWGDVPASPLWCFEAITIRWSISEVFKLYRGNHQVRPLRAKSSSEMTPTLTCSKTGFNFIFTKLFSTFLTIRKKLKVILWWLWPYRVETFH